MRRFLTAGILVVLIAASALAGYEIGVHQPVWSSSTNQIAKPEAKSEQAAADDVTFSVIFDRTVRQAVAQGLQPLRCAIAAELWLEGVLAELPELEKE